MRQARQLCAYACDMVKKMTKTITIKGNGRLSLKPDCTVVSLTLREVDMDYGRAMEVAAEELERLKGAIAAVGFEPEELKTVNFNVNSEYDSEPDDRGMYRQVFKGFACSHFLKLEFDLDTKRLGEVLSAMSASVAEPMINVGFCVKDRSATADALLESAVRDAEKKALVIASAAGKRLGDILSIDYNWGEINMFSNARYATDGALRAYASEAKCIDINPENIDLSDTVTIVWELV